MELLLSSILALAIGCMVGAVAGHYVRIDDTSSTQLHCSIGALGALVGIVLFHIGGGRGMVDVTIMQDIVVAFAASVVTLGVSRSVTRITAR